MALKARTLVPLALASAALMMLVVAEVASATHPRPKSASPVTVSLVPAYNQCTAPNRTHGPPLAFPSCNPPSQTSTKLTVGSPDANGAAANSVAFIKIKVLVGVPGPPDDSDVLLTSQSSDVRCIAAGPACGAANAAAGPDYVGEVQGDAQIRITDHFNAVAPGGGTDPATVVDIPFPVNATCTSTGGTGVGSNCNVNTSANAVVPGAVKDGKRAIVEIGQVQVKDGGPDGVVSTEPNTVFAVQGIFIP